MEAFIIGLVAVVGLSFLVEIILANPSAPEIAKGFIPSIPNDQALYIAIGIIGATVMPHNLYLHSALVQTRKIQKTTAGIKQALKWNNIDSAVALNVAFLVNAAILILAAKVFFSTGRTDVAELKEAHGLLAGLLGTKVAPILFAVALIAAGQSSTITGTLAGQIVMEGYLNLRIAPWLRRLITRLIAIIPAFIVISIYGESQTGAMLIFSQVVLSLQLGFAIVPLIHFNSDKEKMGVFVIKPWVKIAAWLIAGTIISLNVKLVIQELTGWLAAAGDSAWILWITVVPVVIGAGLLLLYIIFKPLIERRAAEKDAKIPHGTAVTLDVISSPVYKRIAITLDFSSIDALTIQSALAQGRTQASYLLLHVVETAGAMVYGSDIADHESTKDTVSLENYKTQLIAKGYNVNVMIGYGNPRRTIPKMVTEFDADLLVMGAHGHKFFKDLIFGTTVDTVRHRVKVPVLIVRQKQ
jgi:manganese transport protein